MWKMLLHLLVYQNPMMMMMDISSVSNSLDPDQAQHFIGPDLVPNCFQKLSADDTSRQRGNYSMQGSHHNFYIIFIFFCAIVNSLPTSVVC